MWRSRHNAYRGDGAFGQYALVMPEQDAIIAITSETADMQGELNLIWKILLPAMQKGKLAANNRANAMLKSKLGELSLPVKKEVMPASLTRPTSFKMEPNAQNISSISFNCKNDDCEVMVETNTASNTIRFAANSWQQGETKLKGPYLVSGAKNYLTGLPDFKVAAEYTWIDANTLELVLRYIESPHTQTMLCRFEGENITVDMKRSFNTNAPGAVITLKGKAQ
jgi:hypothetical protein